MKFRTKFNIPETATESLIKFMKLVLNEISGNDFKDFLDSIFLAKQALDLKDRFQSFVPCSKCHKLYLKKEVEQFCQGETPTIMKCRHIEYPNSASRRLQKCDEPLSCQVRNDFQSRLICPFVGI